MQITRRYWYIVTLIFGLFGLVLVSCLSPSPNSHQKPDDPHKKVATPVRTVPVSLTPTKWEGGRLKIPSIYVDAPIEAVGLLSNGSMGVPTKNPWEHVGWYQYGPAPGSRGSAVIDGHLDRPGGVPAVFWRLHELRVGDDVIVTETKGKTLRFRVTHIGRYTPAEAPREKIFTDTSGRFLNLITCSGEWVPERQETTHRLVVYTVLVS